MNRAAMGATCGLAEGDFSRRLRRLDVFQIVPFGAARFGRRTRGPHAPLAAPSRIHEASRHEAAMSNLRLIPDWVPPGMRRKLLECSQDVCRRDIAQLVDDRKPEPLVTWKEIPLPRIPSGTNEQRKRICEIITGSKSHPEFEYVEDMIYEISENFIEDVWFLAKSPKINEEVKILSEISTCAKRLCVLISKLDGNIFRDFLSILPVPEKTPYEWYSDETFPLKSGRFDVLAAWSLLYEFEHWVDDSRNYQVRGSVLADGAEEMIRRILGQPENSSEFSKRTGRERLREKLKGDPRRRLIVECADLLLMYRKKSGRLAIPGSASKPRQRKVISGEKDGFLHTVTRLTVEYALGINKHGSADVTDPDNLNNIDTLHLIGEINPYLMEYIRIRDAMHRINIYEDEPNYSSYPEKLRLSYERAKKRIFHGHG